jgi:hypothetical protein
MIREIPGITCPPTVRSIYPILGHLIIRGGVFPKCNTHLIKYLGYSPSPGIRQLHIYGSVTNICRQGFLPIPRVR